MIRIGFNMIGGANWAGGLHYLANLLSALKTYQEDSVEAVLFVGPDESPKSLEVIRTFLKHSPIVDPCFSDWIPIRAARMGWTIFSGKDRWATSCFRDAEIDVVFQSPPVLYGKHFEIPTIAWIPDFQHRQLLDAFSPLRRHRRDLAYRTMARQASRVMLSSQSAADDCRAFYPEIANKIEVVPFIPDAPPPLFQDQVFDVLGAYGLVPPYIFLPNQFWKHKNHEIVIKALELLRQQGGRVTIVATGALIDPRHPSHPQGVLESVRRSGLGDEFRYLGVVPREHLFALMQGAAALLNPSLFEGWSSTVEEAKALGVPLVLSDLRVHREQCPKGGLFFDPQKPESLASCLMLVVNRDDYGVNQISQAARLSEHLIARQVFASAFKKIAENVIQTNRYGIRSRQGSSKN